MIKNLGTIKYKQEDSNDCPTLYKLSTTFTKYGFHVGVKSFTKKSNHKSKSFIFESEKRFNKRSWIYYPDENQNHRFWAVTDYLLQRRLMRERQ